MATPRPFQRFELEFHVNPARFRPIRVGPMGHLKVKPSDLLAFGRLPDVLVCVLGINADPDVRVFAGDEDKRPATRAFPFADRRRAVENALSCVHPTISGLALGDHACRTQSMPRRCEPVPDAGW